MNNEPKDDIYFKFLAGRQIQVSKEEWETDWKLWYRRNHPNLNDDLDTMSNLDSSG
jgi:hypothetical protein